MAETETIDRLFLELSQFTTAKTERELRLIAERDRLQGELWRPENVDLTMAAKAAARLAQAKVTNLEGEVERLREELEGANECLEMVNDRIEHLGEPMNATPPFSYNDAISSLVFRRLKEAGAFPGHPATVTYEPTKEPERFRRVPVEAVKAKEGES